TPTAGSGSTSVAVAFQPTTPGGKTATLEITSSTGSRSVMLMGSASCPAINVTGTLPGAALGQLYVGSVTASGGSEPYSFTLNGGSLPPGLSLHPSRSVTGTPTAPCPFPLTLLPTPPTARTR